MLARVAPAPLTERRVVAIELVGDLDAELAAILAETIDSLTRQGECKIAIGFKRISDLDREGLMSVARAIAQRRLEGWPISASLPRNRRMRTILSGAGIPIDEGPADCARHIIIARTHRGEALKA